MRASYMGYGNCIMSTSINVVKGFQATKWGQCYHKINGFYFKPCHYNSRVPSLRICARHAHCHFHKYLVRNEPISHAPFFLFTSRPRLTWMAYVMCLFCCLSAARSARFCHHSVRVIIGCRWQFEITSTQYEYYKCFSSFAQQLL